MAHKELGRVGVIRNVADRVVLQREAALQMGLRVRLVRTFRDLDAAGLVSGHRGRPGNNRIAASVREHFIGLVRSRYHDFDPTLAHEEAD